MNNQDCLVSVVITTYKRPLFILHRAIESVLKQTHTNLEIFVVDDQPEDRQRMKQIQETIHAYKDLRLSYIGLKEHGGACKARNVGIQHANGDFIAFLDDDDCWLPQKIEKQLEGFINEDIGMVYSPYINIADQSSEKVFIPCQKSGDLTQDLLWFNCIGGCSMTLIRSKILKICGVFDESLLSCQDYDLWMRIAQCSSIQFVPFVGIKKFDRRDSITNNIHATNQGFNIFIQKYQHLYQQFPNIYNYRLNLQGYRMIRMKSFKNAWLYYKRALHVKFFSRYNILWPFRGYYHLLKITIKKRLYSADA